MPAPNDKQGMTREEYEAQTRAIAEKAAADLYESKMAETLKAQKSQLQAQFEEAYQDAEASRNMRGIKAKSPIQKFASIVTIFAKAKGDVERMVKVAEKDYPDDREIKGYVEKAAQASVGDSGGFSIPQVLSAQYIDALYSLTFLDKVSPRVLPMANGNITLNRIDTKSSIGWQGEKPVKGDTTEAKIGDVKLSARKIWAIAEITRDLMRYSGTAGGYEGLLIRDLQRNFMIELNRAAVYGKGNENVPLGISLQTGIQTIGSTSTDLDQYVLDGMIAALKEADVLMTNPHWIMTPFMEAWIKGLHTTTNAWLFREELNQGKLCSIPVHTSTQMSYLPINATRPCGDILLADWDEFLWGKGLDMELTMTTEGSIVDAAGDTLSAFQRDSALVRITGQHDFAVAQPKAFILGTYRKPA